MPSLLCGVELRATDGGDAARCEAGGPSPSILEARSVSRPPALTAPAILKAQDTADEATARMPGPGVNAGEEVQTGNAKSADVAAGKWKQRPLPTFLEGVRVIQEVHDGKVAVTRRNQSGYTRLMVRCPCQGHCEQRPGKRSLYCEARRGIGQEQTANFGELEPYGFLGAWLQGIETKRFPTRTLHMAWRPTTEDVRTYMMAQGWLD